MATNISTVKINATKQRVWDTLTKPELVKLWQFGSDLSTSWEIGSRIEFATEWNGNVFRQWGTVLEFNPAGSLSYTLFAPRPDLEDRPENYFTMQYVLKEIDGAIQVEITQNDDRPGAVQEAPQGEENPVLQALKQTAENS